MGIIKLIFWFCVTVVLAYFMTDIKVGGKTIKENIDSFIQSDSGDKLKGKARDALRKGLEVLEDKSTLDQKIEKITQRDEDKLEKLIKRAE